MASPQDDASLKELLRHGKLRVTSVRMAILRALGNSPVALEAAEVASALHAAGEDADRVTVYRTLNSLVDSGIAHRIDPGDRIFRFSLTDHGRCTGEHHEHEHPHMVCDTCGAVECIMDAEVTIKPRSGAQPPARQKFKVTQQDIMLHGTCDRCADATSRGQALPKRR
jgi:Fur family ferric uptake transcriptional regulator